MPHEPRDLRLIGVDISTAPVSTCSGTEFSLVADRRCGAEAARQQALVLEEAGTRAALLVVELEQAGLTGPAWRDRPTSAPEHPALASSAVTGLRAGQAGPRAAQALEGSPI